MGLVCLERHPSAENGTRDRKSPGIQSCLDTKERQILGKEWRSETGKPVWEVVRAICRFELGLLRSDTREDEISHKVRDGPVQYMIGELVKGLLQCVNCVSWMTLRQVAYKK